MIETAELVKIRSEAEQLLRTLVSAGRDELVRVLSPRVEDYARVFAPEIVQTAIHYYAEMWLSPPKRLARPDQTQLDVVACQSERLGDENEYSREFPGGYRRIAHLLLPDRVWIRFKLVAPDATLGMAHDGLVKLDDHWAWFPKPWRLLGDEDTGN